VLFCWGVAYQGALIEFEDGPEGLLYQANCNTGVHQLYWIRPTIRNLITLLVARKLLVCADVNLRRLLDRKALGKMLGHPC
jgi:hypothetical protein